MSTRIEKAVKKQNVQVSKLFRTLLQYAIDGEREAGIHFVNSELARPSELASTITGYIPVCSGKSNVMLDAPSTVQDSRQAVHNAYSRLIKDIMSSSRRAFDLQETEESRRLFSLDLISRITSLIKSLEMDW